MGDQLLGYYGALFEKVLSQRDQKLLVIGYGFRDEYLNKILRKAIEGHNLELYIICPKEPRDFEEHLRKFYAHTDKRTAEVLWQGVHGYFSSSLSELFPSNHAPSDEVSVLKELLYG